MELDLDNDVSVPLEPLRGARPHRSEAQHPGEVQSLHDSYEGHESLPLRIEGSTEGQDVTDLTSPPSPVESRPLSPSLTASQPPSALESVDEAGSRHGRPRRYWRTTLASSVTFLMAITVITCFSIWLVYALKHKVVIGNDATGVFGSKLSLTKAKGFQSSWNALIAPMIFFLLDAFWFSVARVAMISEKSSRMIALRPLAAASSTDAGTYNMAKIYKIVRKSRFNMIPFATLVVLSGIALAAVANTVAYEAYSDVAGGTSVFLRTLKGSSGSTYDPFSFSTQQMANFSGEVNGMLTSLSYQNAEDKLESESYIGVNATRASLNALSPDIVRLYNIPGYRLSIGCQAQPPNSFGPAQMGGFFVSIALVFSDGYLLNALYPGQLATMGDEHYDPFTFVGFTSDKMQAYLGCALRFNGSTPQTPYGRVSYRTFEMPQEEFVGTKKFQSVYGLRCKVSRQKGLHNLTREKDLSWKRTTSSWDGPKIDTPLLISEWQVALNFHGPSNPSRANTGLEPGIGPVFWASAVITNPDRKVVGDPETIDYRVLAHNFLYAAGETERISYEVQSVALIREKEGMFEVQATRSDIFYKLTYVPALLIVGLLGIFCSFFVCSAMVCINWGSQSFKQWRKVDLLRLLVDAVDGLRDEPSVRNIQDVSNDRLDQWGKGFNVRYVKSEDDARIVLQHQ